jgi:hypothetical protein
MARRTVRRSLPARPRQLAAHRARQARACALVPCRSCAGNAGASRETLGRSAVCVSLDEAVTDPLGGWSQRRAGPAAGEVCARASSRSRPADLDDVVRLRPSRLLEQPATQAGARVQERPTPRSTVRARGREPEPGGSPRRSCGGAPRPGTGSPRGPRPPLSRGRSPRWRQGRGARSDPGARRRGSARAARATARRLPTCP